MKNTTVNISQLFELPKTATVSKLVYSKKGDIWSITNIIFTTIFSRNIVWITKGFKDEEAARCSNMKLRYVKSEATRQNHVPFGCSDASWPFGPLWERTNVLVDEKVRERRAWLPITPFHMLTSAGCTGTDRLFVWGSNKQISSFPYLSNGSASDRPLPDSSDGRVYFMEPFMVLSVY